MRLYLPATLDELTATTEGDALLAGRTAHAVTQALRAALPDEDEEGWEFAAHLAAADDSLDLLRSRPEAPALRLVVTVDVPDDAVGVGPQPGATPSAVLLTRAATLAEVACVHVDEPAVAGDVRAALSGDVAADERVAEADLLWYDVSEIGDIPT
ncbi:DUF6912 family protein [Cellulomonas gilvus]|uniref:Uncharacterized protein n=1 Tax=Cellulomonas gilvus (strain ATCC 13127 / NRRL B-14078) TaxID=593907 RepID=F8A1B8_CELGA|nr:hypothetical protein [Cellulomonas gilvus]AEI11665.1 hypothetical protein Celgi_1146 [Cellulomonas gilvus ATCC 13127]